MRDRGFRSRAFASPVAATAPLAGPGVPRTCGRSDRRIFEPLRREFELPIERVRWEQPVERACYRLQPAAQYRFPGPETRSNVSAAAQTSGSRHTRRPFDVPSGRLANTTSSRPVLSCSINSALTSICTSSFTPGWSAAKRPSDGQLPHVAAGDARRRATSPRHPSARRCVSCAGTGWRRSANQNPACVRERKRSGHRFRPSDTIPAPRNGTRLDRSAPSAASSIPPARSWRPG
jgi:hypothetical protein